MVMYESYFCLLLNDHVKMFRDICRYIHRYSFVDVWIYDNKDWICRPGAERMLSDLTFVCRWYGAGGWVIWTIWDSFYCLYTRVSGSQLVSTIFSKRVWKGMWKKEVGSERWKSKFTVTGREGVAPRVEVEMVNSSFKLWVVVSIKIDSGEGYEKRE